MGSLSVWHWGLVLVVAMLMFGGRGKISGLMGEAARGVRAFKDGLSDDGGESVAKADERQARDDGQLRQDKVG